MYNNNATDYSKIILFYAHFTIARKIQRNYRTIFEAKFSKPSTAKK